MEEFKSLSNLRSTNRTSTGFPNYDCTGATISFDCPAGTVFNWLVSWSGDVDGNDWHTRIFERLEDARAYVRMLAAENEGNGRFGWFADRFVQVANDSFLEEEDPVMVEVIQAVRVHPANLVEPEGVTA